MCKSTEEYEAVIKSEVRENDKLGSKVLVFSVASDNETSVALGADRNLKFVCSSMFLPQACDVCER